jgi:prepilin-type N-terminal cleavage/methylation domain-containing protein/prepilin-type processing-associated H-X9-DG protein
MMKTNAMRVGRCLFGNKETMGVARSGFTLVEMLLVVAILSMLIALLLPMVSQAKEYGHQAVCMNNLRQAGIGFGSYASDCQRYTPGPNTSGYFLKGVNPTNVDSEPTDPITFDDWMSPTLGRAIGLPRKKIDRLLAILNHEFRCGSNTFKYDYIYPSQGSLPPANQTYYSSYSAPFPLHYYYDAAHASANRQPNGSIFGNSFDKGVDTRTAGYKFRMSTKGAPSGKVFATEGSRYIDADGRVSFNADWGSAFGGNFMNRSPVLNVIYQGNGSPYKFSTYPKLHPHSAKYAYRHVNDTLNAVFFDGHVKNLDNLASRKISYWYPKGSKVISTTELGDKSVSVGHIVE